ncbi:hypothetical protein [Nocardia wallacei]|uniref:UsfY protein n=1 Tax=Nocardia wallacei TaxID=480035 RepID=A0A7G1KCT8_9NOCA|nr:hypothetical protein [Nocardia wallacei]BCK52978.1 hypothetical protein NWFMUON74_07500 [Nocardia wallacei]
MTVEGPAEIPPLDDATDIARSAEVQPGETLADTRNWAGFVVLLFGVLAAIVAITALLAGASQLALVSAVFAAAGSVIGVGLIVMVRRGGGRGAGRDARQQRARH